MGFRAFQATQDVHDTQVEQTKPNGTGWTRRRVVAITGSASLLAACEAPGGATPGASGTGSDTPAKLLVKIRSGPTYEQAFKEGIALFKQKFPKTEVDYFPEESGWPEKLMAGWAAGAGADIFQAWDDHFWRFAASGSLVNINDLLKDYKKADLDDFVKGQWAGFQIPHTNIRYGMPTYINTGVLYYNRNTFAKAGVKEPNANWTYTDYAEAAKRLIRNEGSRQVYGVHHPLGYGRTQSTLWAFGGQYVDPKDFKKTTAHMPEAQSALNWLQERLWKDNSFLLPKNRPSGFNMQTALGDGLVAMSEDGMHALKNVAAIEGMEFDIAPIPKGPKQRMSWITTDGWGMWSGSQARGQAWEFTKFLASPEWYKLQARHDLLIPSRISALDEWIQVVRSKFPSLEKVNLKGVKDQLTASPPVVSTWPQFLCAADANKVVGDTLVEVLNEGTAKPNIFQARKDQIEQAAGGCGMVLK